MLPRDREEISGRMDRLRADIDAGRITAREFNELIDHWCDEQQTAEDMAMRDLIELGKLRVA